MPCPELSVVVVRQILIVEGCGESPPFRKKREKDGSPARTGGCSERGGWTPRKGGPPATAVFQASLRDAVVVLG